MIVPRTYRRPPGGHARDGWPMCPHTQCSTAPPGATPPHPPRAAILPAHTNARRREQNGCSAPPAEIGRDTSELQSRGHLVCRLLLEKKKNIDRYDDISRPD